MHRQWSVCDTNASSSGSTSSNSNPGQDQIIQKQPTKMTSKSRRKRGANGNGELSHLSSKRTKLKDLDSESSAGLAPVPSSVQLPATVPTAGTSADTTAPTNIATNATDTGKESAEISLGNFQKKRISFKHIWRTISCVHHCLIIRHFFCF